MKIPKIPKISKKAKISFCILCGISFSFANPAYALDLGIDDFFKEIIGEVKGYANTLKAKVEGEITAKWEGMKEDAKSAISNSIGDMGIPDSVEAGEKLKKKLKKQTIFQKSTRADELERVINRQSVAATLGKEGQTQLKNSIDKTKEVAQKSQDSARLNDSLADIAQSADSTQDVLKTVAKQQAILSEQNSQIVWMLGKQRSDNIQSRLAQAQGNLMLGQIAESQAANQRKERLQNNTNTATAIEMSTMLQLDVSSKY